MATERPLTEMQQRFVDEFVRLGRGAAAARAAGYAPKRADGSAYTLLRDPRVKAAIDAERLARRERSRKSGDDIIAQLERIAFADPRNVANWTAKSMTLVPGDDLDSDTAATIAEIKIKEGMAGTSVGFKLHDPVRALQLLGQHHALFGKDGDDARRGSDDALGVVEIPALEPAPQPPSAEADA